MASLEMELRTLRASQDDLVAKFDEALQVCVGGVQHSPPEPSKLVPPDWCASGFVCMYYIRIGGVSGVQHCGFVE